MNQPGLQPFLRVTGIAIIGLLMLVACSGGSTSDPQTAAQPQSATAESEPAPTPEPTASPIAAPAAETDWIEEVAAGERELQVAAFELYTPFGPRSSVNPDPGLTPALAEFVPGPRRFVNPYTQPTALQIFEYGSMEPIAVITPENRARQAKVTSDGEYVVTAEVDAARMYSIAAGEVTATFEFSDPVINVWPSPLGDYLIVASGEEESDDDFCCFHIGNLHVVDIASGEIIGTLLEQAQTLDRTEVQFSPDGDFVRLQFGSTLWRVATAETIPLPVPLAGDPGIQTFGRYTVPFDTFGDRFIRAGHPSEDGVSLEVVSLVTFEVLGTLPFAVDAAIHPTGDLIATAATLSDDDVEYRFVIDLFDGTAMEPVRTLEALIRPRDEGIEDFLRYGMGPVSFSPDGKYLMASVATGQVVVWHVESGEVRLDLDFPESVRESPHYPMAWAAWATNGSGIWAGGGLASALWHS